MRVALLGPVEAWGPAGRVELGGPKEQVTFTLLAAAAGATVPAARIVDTLWGEDPPPSALRTVQAHVSRIRRALADAGIEDAIEALAGGWRVATEVVLDVDEAHALVAAATAARADGDDEAAASALRSARGLWRGSALGSLAELDGLRPIATSFEELRRGVQELHLDVELACGRHAVAVAELESLVAQEPLRERLWELLVLALYRCGRQADALRAYQRARRTLRDEVGVEPGPALRRLEADIVAHAPHLDRSTAPGSRSLDQLPEGVLTFVLTDVEGSTVLWDEREEAMRAALAAHDEAVARAVALHGGILLKHKGEGDSTVSVFVDPSAAVAAALDQQRFVAAASRDGDLELRVRASVHTGPADRVDGDYVGPTLNRAARVRGLAAGGQVLVSERASIGIGLALPSGASLRDLGRHRLKGLARPEQVFQLVHPDLRSDFPPLASLDARSTNLPLVLTSLVGRREELARVRELVGLARLVTLTGAGGSGKTRLALEAAGEATDDHPGGVWFVELAPVGAAGVGAAVVGAIGLQPQPGQLELDAAVGWLADRGPTLVVLDNCEHVIEAAGEAASRLLAGCPGVTVLATSRERLGLDGEAVWPVPPLGLPSPGEDPTTSEAVQLFCERAVAVRPDFVLDVTRAGAVADLCTRLDGIPLAIELAAARTRVLTPEQILDRLTDRFRLLSGNRSAIPRQQTLRALVDWSHDLLDEVDRVVLRRLAVFRGGFDIDAAEAVAAGDPVDRFDVLDAVASLVDKSLLVVDDGPVARYRMLETIREYGIERLEAVGELEPWSARHLAYCREILGRWQAARDETSDQAATIASMAVEHDNLRAALAYAIDHDPEAACELVDVLSVFWNLKGMLVEGARWARAVRPCLDAVDGRLRAAATTAVGSILAHDRELEGLELMADGVARAEVLGDLLTLARGLSAQAIATRHLQGEEAAGPLFERALAAAEGALAQGVPAARQQVRIAKMQLAWVAGLEAARSLLEEALADCRAAGDLVVEAWTLNTMSWRFDREPGFDVEACLARCLAIGEEVGLRQITHEVEAGLGDLAFDRGDLEAALDLHQRSAAGFRMLGHPWADQGDIRVAWVLARLRPDDARVAVDELRQRFARRPPAGHILAWLDDLRADLAARAGDVAEARALLRDTASRLTAEPLGLGYIALRLAAVEAGAGELDRAATILAAAEIVAEGIPRPPETPIVRDAWAALEAVSPERRAAAYERVAARGADGAVAVILAGGDDVLG